MQEKSHYRGDCTKVRNGSSSPNGFTAPRMGNAVGVALPPERREVIRLSIERAHHAALIARARFQRLVRVAEHWYAVVDERLLSKVQRAVEKQVLKRIQRLIDQAEVKSKLYFVKSISTSSIASAFDIDIADVRLLEIKKREYDVHNCGPELMNVPTLKKTMQPLRLQNPEVAAFLISTCLWTEWQPPVSWRMKVDQIYDLTVHVAVRNNDFLTGEIRRVKLRVGRKWVGPHHHNENMEFAHRAKWLHRTDYETQDKLHTAESAFYQTVQVAWQHYLEELARLPKEDLRPSTANDGMDYDALENRPSLRIKYLLETSLDTIMTDLRPMFRKSYQYEQWRMEQEDATQHRPSSEDHFAGELLDSHIDGLIELYEAKTMAMEDVRIFTEDTGEPIS